MMIRASEPPMNDRRFATGVSPRILRQRGKNIIAPLHRTSSPLMVKGSQLRMARAELAARCRAKLARLAEVADSDPCAPQRIRKRACPRMTATTSSDAAGPEKARASSSSMRTAAVRASACANRPDLAERTQSIISASATKPGLRQVKRPCTARPVVRGSSKSEGGPVPNNSVPVPARGPSPVVASSSSILRCSWRAKTWRSTSA